MMEPSQNNLSVAAVTLRTRAIFNLPSEYNFVYVEIRVGHMRKTWTTQKVPVVDGAALLDFWARIPGTGGETSIELKVGAVYWCVKGNLQSRHARPCDPVGSLVCVWFACIHNMAMQAC